VLLNFFLFTESCLSIIKSLKNQGQGNLHSQPRHLISRSSSIVARLVSRSITGRRLDLQVHQHNGYGLHLVWEHKKSEICFERCFNNYSEIEGFCEELVNGMLEGICGCVSEDICCVLGEDKSKMCYTENYGFDSQKYLYISRDEKTLYARAQTFEMWMSHFVNLQTH
jgi:hypothetical protein